MRCSITEFAHHAVHEDENGHALNSDEIEIIAKLNVRRTGEFMEAQLSADQCQINVKTMDFTVNSKIIAENIQQNL